MDSCTRVDFNKLDMTCFYGTTNAANPLSNNVAVYHWELSRCKASCVNTWKVTVNNHALGLKEFGNAGDLDELGCKTECFRNSSCFSIDYNIQDKTCWFGLQANPTLTGTPFINHWDLIKCPPLNLTDGGSDLDPNCDDRWVEYPGSNSLGALQIPQITQLHQCTAACETMPTCCGLDINALNDRTIECWLHFDPSDFNVRYSTAGRSQYRLHRCPQELSVCQPSYQQTQTNSFSSGGTLNPDAKSLDACQLTCQRVVKGCTGFDYFLDANQCYTLTPDSLGKNLQPRANSNQYTLTSACQSVCKPRWKMFLNTAGVSPHPAQLKLVGDPEIDIRMCLNFCWASVDCVGVEYTEGTAGLCSYYTSRQSADMKNQRVVAGITQYQLVDRCYQRCDVNFEQKVNIRYTITGSQTVSSASSLADCSQSCRLMFGCRVYQVTKSGQFGCVIGQDYVPNTNTTDTNVDTFILQQGSCTSTSAPLPTTPTTPAPSCYAKWTVKSGQNTLGLTMVGGVGDYTEESCKDACYKNSTCNCVDYNTHDLTCFHASLVNPKTQNNFVVNHWDLERVCTNESKCVVNRTLSLGMHASSLNPQGTSGQYDEPSCVNACVADRTCMAVDFNRKDNTCWFSTRSSPPLRPNIDINHWEITRTNC